jgi:hypothetical protein
MMPIWLSSPRSGITSLTLQTTSGPHEELWNVPAGDSPSRSQPPSIAWRCWASRDLPSLTTGLGQPTGLPTLPTTPATKLERSS